MRLHHILSPARSHAGLVAGCLAAFAVTWTLPPGLPQIVRGVLAWDGLVAVFLAATWTVMLRAGHDSMRRRAARYDAGDVMVLIFCLTAIFASLVAITALMAGIAMMAPEVKAFRLGLAVATIAGSWLFLHTILALHYAHAYYWPKHDAHGKSHHGGLDFPGDELPDYADFLYFAFVLGACSQTADVSITGKPIRRLATLHGTLAFVFNAVLLALTVNVAASLL